MNSSLNPTPLSIASTAPYDLKGLTLQKVSYTLDSQMPMHMHAEATLVLILKGVVELDCRKQGRTTGPTSLTFLPAGEPHANHFREGVQAFQIAVGDPWLERLRQVSALVDTPIDYHNSPPNWLAMRLYREFQKQDNLTPLVLEGLTLELLAEVARNPAHSNDIRTPRWLKQAKDFLHAHFTESLPLAVVAASVGVHPSHLMYGFRQHYHCTPGDYVRRLRVEYACHLLSTSETPLSQIALAAGFADQSHLSRTFKQLTGMTPASFQKTCGCPSLRQKIIF